VIALRDWLVGALFSGGKLTSRSGVHLFDQLMGSLDVAAIERVRSIADVFKHEGQASSKNTSMKQLDEV